MKALYFLLLFSVPNFGFAQNSGPATAKRKIAQTATESSAGSSAVEAPAATVQPQSPAPPVTPPPAQTEPAQPSTQAPAAAQPQAPQTVPATPAPAAPVAPVPQVQIHQPILPTPAPSAPQPILPTQATQPQPATPIEDLNRRWRFVLGFGYILGSSDGSFDDAVYSENGLTVTGSAKLEYEKTHSIILEGRYLPKNSWGFLGGLNYEGERKFRKGSLSGGGTTITLAGGSNASKVQFSTLYASMTYRWNDFYIPFGLNFSSVKFTPAQGFSGTYSEKGGIGGQFGVGWMIQDRFAIEAYSWNTVMELRASSSGTTLDYGKGRFNSLLLVGKYAF